MERSLNLGALPPDPRDLSLFSRQNGRFQFEGGIGCRPLPIPAAEPVARVASLRCPIPSGSGSISMHHTASPLKTKAADRNYQPERF
jgi:hypothetical protein